MKTTLQETINAYNKLNNGNITPKERIETVLFILHQDSKELMKQLKQYLEVLFLDYEKFVKTSHSLEKMVELTSIKDSLNTMYNIVLLHYLKDNLRNSKTVFTEYQDVCLPISKRIQHLESINNDMWV